MIHGDPVTFLLLHVVLLCLLYSMSTGLCFVTFPRMGGVMAQMYIVQNLS